MKSGDRLALLYSESRDGAIGLFEGDAKLNVAEQAFVRAKYLLTEKVLALADAQRRLGEMLNLRAEKQEARDRLKLLECPRNR